MEIEVIVDYKNKQIIHVGKNMSMKQERKMSRAQDGLVGMSLFLRWNALGNLISKQHLKMDVKISGETNPVDI